MSGHEVSRVMEAVIAQTSTTIGGEITHAHHRELARPLRPGAFHAATALSLGGVVFAALLGRLVPPFRTASAEAAAVLADVRMLYALGELEVLLIPLVGVMLPALGIVIGLLTLLTVVLLAGQWGAASATAPFAPGVNAGSVSFAIGPDVLTVRHARAVTRFRWRDLSRVEDRRTCSLLIFPDAAVIVPAGRAADGWRPLFEAAEAGMAIQTTGVEAEALLPLPTGEACRSISAVLTPYDLAVFSRRVARRRNVLTAAIDRFAAPQAPYLVLGILGTVAVAAGWPPRDPFVLAFLIFVVGANWTRFFGHDALEQAWGLDGFERYDRRVELTVTAEGLADLSGSSWAFYAWPAFRYVASSRDGLYLHLAPGLAVILPSHAFASAEEQEDWRAALEGRLSGRDENLASAPSSNGSSGSLLVVQPGPWGRAAA